ncbi:MAG: glycerol-3-phosphate dehydrogenase [Alphaproteobacteria bacterium]|nr:glycerol-3-phosphate dehydrogenase [Alphaproteobacteria bacterium]
MREGSLDAPVRHPLGWDRPDFYDEAKLDAELHRVFDICHGCRRCFNLCDSFPRLFDLVDNAPTGELDSVDSKDFKQVVNACTLCDMCFLTKCPYVPPHEFNLDFPHLMLRYRAVELRKHKVPLAQRQLTETDRNGKLASLAPAIANWASQTGNAVTRPLMERALDVDRRAKLPKFHGRTFALRAKAEPPTINAGAPGFGRKAVLYATCFVNYNGPDIGMAARAVLARNGVETVVAYPGCCGMPQLEHGDLARVASNARTVAAGLKEYIDKGFDIIALVPSCALMLKFEWPLILPGDESVKRLSAATFDLSEYVVDIAKREGLADGLRAIDGGVSLHIACHARAQNIGQKAAEMLRLIPGADVAVIERCSGHGGSWGVTKENFDVAVKVGKPVARQAMNAAKAHLASECPLAADHIAQGVELLGGTPPVPEHPIQIFARAYGLA